MISYARNFLNHPKRFSRCYQKDFPNRTKRFSWWYKKILLSVQKDSPDRTKTFYWAYKNILLIAQNHFIKRQTLKYYKSFGKIKKEKSKTITVQIFLNTPSPLTLSKKIISDIRTSVNELLDCIETSGTEQTRID